MQYKMPSPPAPLRRFWAIYSAWYFSFAHDFGFSYFELGNEDKAKAYAIVPIARVAVAAIRYPTVP